MSANRNLLSAFFAIITAACALAMDVRIGVSTPGNGTEKDVIIQIGRPPGISVPIPPGITATDKRDRIVAALRAHGYIVALDGPTAFVILGLPDGLYVRMFANGTRERHDELRVPSSSGFRPPWMRIWYQGQFTSVTPEGDSSVFLAGIRTDAGEVSAVVRGEELDPNGELIDGERICAALFERLSRSAADIGATVLVAGDRLDVYFDPAYSLEFSGVSFGTTSESEGASASMAEEPNCPGDLDGDNAVTIIDLSMLLANFGGPAPDDGAGDLDGDGDIDLTDLAGLLTLFGTHCE